MKRPDSARGNSDDFSAAKVLANMFELSSVINSIKDGHIKKDALSAATFSLLQKQFAIYLEDIFGLQSVSSGNNDTLKGVMDLLVDIRKEAKTKKDYATSDKIRNQLSALGIVVKDEKDGSVSWDVN